MTTRLLLSAVLALSTLPISADEPASAPLFNGKDLSGWVMKDGKEADGTFWKAADGTIVGENNPEKKGSMLYTRESYLNFEFEAEARWNGEIDSGFMMRKPELQMQIGVSRSLKRDMTGSFYTGKYPEEAQAKEAGKLVKPGDWNHFKLTVQGDTVTVWINGTQASVYKDKEGKYKEAAPIGLQIHPGLAMKVEFRNLKVKPLK